MRRIETILLRGICIIGIIVFISSCDNSDSIIEEYTPPTIEDIEETFRDVNTEWGISTEAIKKQMKGYSLVTNENENILQYKVRNSSLVIAYQFSSKKLCATVIKVLKEDETLKNVDEVLKGYNYVGELGENKVYTNESDNVFATTYDVTEDNKPYLVIGFTPLYAITEKVAGRDCVDLGMNTKWATCNIGAEKSEDYGGYYAWGETQEKESYSWSTYEYSDGTMKSCENLGDSICKTQYDVASVLWGSPWAMPTKLDMDELRTKCSWVWTTEKGVNGYKVFGENGNYIFLPAAGYKTGSWKNAGSYGYYMTAIPYKTNGYSYQLRFNATTRVSDYISRSWGCSVRAVVK